MTFLAVIRLLVVEVIELTRFTRLVFFCRKVPIPLLFYIEETKSFSYFAEKLEPFKPTNSENTSSCTLKFKIKFYDTSKIIIYESFQMSMSHLNRE